SLRDAAAERVPIVCLQNGVDNERQALRSFESVYGAVVMLPAAHLEPGAVLAYGSELTGIVDIGRYPRGRDELCEAISGALERSRLESRPRADIMRSKYAKLILNLGNAPAALCGPGERTDELIELARGEGRAALSASGIEFDAPEVTDVRGRWERLGVKDID